MHMKNKILTLTTLILLLAGAEPAFAQTVDIEIEFPPSLQMHYLPEDPDAPVFYTFPDGTEVWLRWLEISSEENIEIAVTIGPDNQIPHALYINRGDFNTNDAVVFDHFRVVFALNVNAASVNSPKRYTAWVGIPHDENTRITIEYH